MGPSRDARLFRFVSMLSRGEGAPLCFVDRCCRVVSTTPRLALEWMGNGYDSKTKLPCIRFGRVEEGGGTSVEAQLEDVTSTATASVQNRHCGTLPGLNIQALPT